MITCIYLHDPPPFNDPFFMTPPFSESQKVVTLPPSLVIVKWSLVFNLRAAEKDLFLLQLLRDLPSETCRSGKNFIY